MADKTKLVMIDDEQDLCLVVKANLEDTGEFEVAVLNDPTDAEGFIREENPDLILLDNVMPGRKGSEIATSLREPNSELRGIPIIMVSGKGEMVFNRKKNEFKWLPNNPMAKAKGELPDAKGADALSEAYGVDDYVSKPFTTELLVEVIHDVLKRFKKPSSDADSEPPV